MGTPIRPLPEAIARWSGRARWLRRLDALAAWLLAPRSRDAAWNLEVFASRLRGVDPRVAALALRQRFQHLEPGGDHLDADAVSGNCGNLVLTHVDGVVCDEGEVDSRITIHGFLFCGTDYTLAQRSG